MRDLLPRANLLIAWLVALSGAALIAYYFAGASTQFFGVTDAQEQSIRFTTSVRIASYGFLSGQEVSAGDLIVQVEQPDLDAELKMVSEQIHALTSGNRETRASMQAEVVQQQAELQAKLTEVDAAIRELRARREAARSFTSTLGGTGEDAGDAALRQELDSLETRRQALRRATAARTGDLNSRLANSNRPVDAQIAELTQRQQELERQRTEHRVFAQLPGRLGNVLFKLGDTVPPYQPVLTVYGSRPSFVTAYIHESVLNDVQLHQRVWLQSAGTLRATPWYEGTVESLGSRIVEFPVRLKVSPLAQAWGREVVIRLRSDHQLLLGEKVVVQLRSQTSLLASLAALFSRSSS